MLPYMAVNKNILSQATFGELLRRWRRVRRLSQGGLGALLVPTVHHTTVSCWESDSNLPSHKYLNQILVLTGIPADLALGLPPREAGNP